jgi:hypothetical protein
MPQPIRYGSPNWQVSSSAALESAYQSWACTCQLREPYPRSMQKPYHFWPQITPSVNIPYNHRMYMVMANPISLLWSGFIEWRSWGWVALWSSWQRGLRSKHGYAWCMILTLAPILIPREIKNMLAMECSCRHTKATVQTSGSEYEWIMEQPLHHKVPWPPFILHLLLSLPSRLEQGINTAAAFVLTAFIHKKRFRST